MRRSVAGWAESGRAVGGALLAVWRAELQALRRDFARSGRQLRGVLILAVVTAAVCFWTVGLGLWSAVEALATRWPRWAAVLAVFGIGLVATLLLAWLAARRARRIEPPIDTLQRHGREHLEWWQESVLPDLVGPAVPRRRQPARASDEEERGESELE